MSGPFLHRSWLNVPHVTHNDDADITELDAYRKELDTAAKAEKNPYRVTLLAFLVKAVVAALKKHPEFNSSLTPEKDAMILKQYYNIGIAVDTPGGLVVPVVKDADRKGIVELSREFMEISAKARDGKLKPDDMQGGTFTISSLGGIGGTSFTPIVNAPEVAILGVVRSAMKPVWNGTEFVPRQHAAAVGVLRPPRHRRRAGRPIHPPPLLPARGRPPPAALTVARPDPGLQEGVRHGRAGDPRPRHRRLHRRPDHRDPRQPGRHGGAGGPAAHPGADKATLDVPSPVAGTVVSLAVAVGDTVSEGTVIGTVEVDAGPREARRRRSG